MTDGLTGVLNRRGFTTQGSSLLAHAAQHQLPMTALMLDLDHFKQVNEVNDPHGHEAGDRALQLFARLLGETCRSGDLIGRLGGTRNLAYCCCTTVHPPAWRWTGGCASACMPPAWQSWALRWTTAPGWPSCSPVGRAWRN